MIKNWKITIAFILGSVFVSFISGNIKIDNLSVAEIIGEVLGSLFILYVIPLLLTYLIKLFAKWTKNDIKGNGFVTSYAILWGIITFLVLYGSLIKK